MSVHSLKYFKGHVIHMQSLVISPKLSSLDVACPMTVNAGVAHGHNNDVLAAQ